MKKTWLQAGMKFKDCNPYVPEKSRKIIIMAVVQGWVMAKRPRGVPFVLTVKEMEDSVEMLNQL